jgi:hypothetical protein
MRTLPLFASAFILCIASCSTPGPEPEIEVPAPPPPVEVKGDPPPSAHMCFLRVTRSADVQPQGRSAMPVSDSLIIELRIEGDRVKGRYDWLPAEKDRLTGPLEGRIDDNVITAVHSYSAEGTTAKEEKVMLIKGDQLWLKTGELIERHGTWVIKDKDAAPWAEAIPLVPCK